MSVELLAGVVGGAIGVAGGVFVTITQIVYDRSKQKAAHKLKLAEKRRLACVKLLSTTRRLRQVSLRTFQKRAHETDIDGIYAEIYAALYTVKSICPKPVADLAQKFFDEAREFWQLSVEEPDAPQEKWEAKRAKVKTSVQKFRASIREDFAVSIDEDLDELEYS